MSTSKLYKLVRETCSVDLRTVTIVTIPEGEIVEFLGRRPPDGRMVNIRWNDRVLLMFEQDVLRAEEQQPEA